MEKLSAAYEKGSKHICSSKIRDMNQLQDIKKIIKENVRWVKLFS